MALIPVPYELKDRFKRRFRTEWRHEMRMWRISCWEMKEAQAWIARELAKLEAKKKKPAR